MFLTWQKINAFIKYCYSNDVILSLKYANYVNIIIELSTTNRIRIYSCAYFQNVYLPKWKLENMRLSCNFEYCKVGNLFHRLLKYFTHNYKPNMKQINVPTEIQL